MTTRYCGIGGNDANSGLTWALRKATLNGLEDSPVAAGDVCYIGPGAYREVLTVDVSGGAGSPITYIGDVTGEHTDGVGGIVRITGSDNDQTIARTYCINATSTNYRTFRGFLLDSCSDIQIRMITLNNWIIEDCSMLAPYSSSCIRVDGAQSDVVISRCVFIAPMLGLCVYFYHSAAVDNCNHVVSDCLFIGSHTGYGVRSDKIGGISIKNCTFINGGYGIRVAGALTAGQTVTVNNCILYGFAVALQATAVGEVVENYNSLFANQTDRTNVAVGANSNTYPPLFNPPILLDGFRFPWYFGELSKWSQLARIAGTSEATDDLFGLTRPATSAKKSWGAIQATGAAREATTVDSGTASLKLPDAGEQFFMRVPVTAVATTFTVKCYREADYAGTNPTLIVRQAGQADQTYTDVGAAGAWNTLTVTCTPAADPEWVDLFVASYNTAVAGNFDSFFDSATVS